MKRALINVPTRCIRLYSNKASNSTSGLKRPQYDFKLLRKNAQIFQDSLERREMALPEGTSSVPELMQSYEQLIYARKRRDELLHERNQLQKQIKTNPDAKGRLGELKGEIKQHVERINSLEEPVMNAIECIPNLISPGSHQLSDIEEVDRLNPDNYMAADPKRDHFEIAQKVGDIVDFPTAAKVSGASWYYLLEKGALLEMALTQYAISKARKRGWKMVIPPAAIRPSIASACGFKPRDQNGEQQTYPVGDNLCLAGTAEIPLAGLGLNSKLSDISIKPDANGTIRALGISRAYRAEAGARGRDTKGLYRVHEFTKVELFAWTLCENSDDMLQEILALQKEIIGDLGLCARVLNMPPNELGAPAYQKYDIEAWMPGRDDWGEVSSASNCLDFQSRRLHTKADDSTFCHTLNGTAMAVPRVIIAIIENFYDPKTSKIAVPSVLRPFIDDLEFL